MGVFGDQVGIRLTVIGWPASSSTRAGFRIGDGRHVDLFRYAAWLVELRHTPRPQSDADPYEKLKERAAARNKALSLAGRDIGELPGVVSPERKEQAAGDFRFFCEHYFPMTFHLPWSPDHLKVMAKIEQAVLRGGLFAMPCPGRAERRRCASVRASGPCFSATGSSWP